MFLTDSPTEDVLLVAIVALMGAHCVHLRGRGRFSVFDPLMASYGGAIVVYVLQPARYGSQLALWHQSDAIESALLAVLFALACLFAGYESRLGTRWGHRFPHPSERLDAGRLSLLAWVLIGIGVAAYGYYASTAGGFRQWLSVGRGGTEWAKVSGYVALLEDLLPAGVALLVFQANMQPVSRDPKALPFAVGRDRVPTVPIFRPAQKFLAWTMGGLMWLWFLYLGSRSRTIQFTGLLLMAWYLPRRKQPRLAVLATLFGALLVITHLQAKYREQFTNLSFHLQQMDQADQKLLPALALGGEAGAPGDVSSGIEFNCVVAAVELVPAQVDYNYGYCLLEFLTRIVPSRFWPAKPYPHYESFTPLYEQGNLSATWVEGPQVPILAGPSFTFVGHWYAVGGWVALLVAGFLTGAFYRALRVWRDSTPGNQGTLLLYPFLVFTGFLDATGTPLFWLFSLPFVCGAVWFVLRIARVRPPASTLTPHAEPQSGRAAVESRKLTRLSNYQVFACEAPAVHRRGFALRSPRPLR